MEKMLYSSTRNNDEKITSSEAILRGIAPDGGLYVPCHFPKLKIEEKMLKYTYKDMAKEVFKLYLTDFTDEEIQYCVDGAYDEKFLYEEIAPVVDFDKLGFLELYHGKTLAFKDMALSILPYLLTTAAKKLGVKEDIVILAATSGDTGKAALEGFANVDKTKIIVFYPTVGISDIQKRQMTTQEGDNTYVYAINGNFDDAQNGVKAIFNNREFKKELKEKGYLFSSANSINIGRLLPQVVYYYYSYVQLLKKDRIKNGEKINVVVPTGNFGNILASKFAKEMGLPVDKFICASNSNSVLTDFIDSGKYDINRDFNVTISPSMDILISSNLERLLYILSDRNDEEIKSYMDQLKNGKEYEISEEMKIKLFDEFKSGYTSDEETIRAIEESHTDLAYILDPHTAVGYDVYKKYKKANKDDENYSVIAATASPYKFTRSVVDAIYNKSDDLSDFELIEVLSEKSGLSIPPTIKDIDKKEIKHKLVIDKNELFENIKKALI